MLPPLDNTRIGQDYHLASVPTVKRKQSSLLESDYHRLNANHQIYNSVPEGGSAETSSKGYQDPDGQSKISAGSL